VRYYYRLKISILIFVMFSSVQLCAQDISIGGSWELTIDESDMQSGMISDLNSTYESPADQVYATITHPDYGWFGTWYWRVDVSRDNSQWHNLLHLDVRRSSGGFGFGSISGGTSYQEISTATQSFFTGARNRLWIGFQYRLRGVSVSVPAGTYVATVTYTVVEL